MTLKGGVQAESVPLPSAPPPSPKPAPPAEASAAEWQERYAGLFDVWGDLYDAADQFLDAVQLRRYGLVLLDKTKDLEDWEALLAGAVASYKEKIRWTVLARPAFSPEFRARFVRLIRRLEEEARPQVVDERFLPGKMREILRSEKMRQWAWSQGQAAGKPWDAYWASEPGFCALFLGSSGEVLETKEDLLAFLDDVLKENDKAILSAALSDWEIHFRAVQMRSEKEGRPTPGYVRALLEDEPRRRRFVLALFEIFYDLGHNSSEVFQLNTLRTARHLRTRLASPSYLPAEEKITLFTTPPEALQVVLGRLPVLCEMVSRGIVSGQEASRRLGPLLRHPVAAAQELEEPLSALLDWAASRREATADVRKALETLAARLKPRGFHVEPLFVTDPGFLYPRVPSAVWSGLITRIVYEGMLDNRKILVVHNLYGYNPYVLVGGYSFSARRQAVIFLHRYITVNRAFQEGLGGERIPYRISTRVGDASTTRRFRDWETSILRQAVGENPELLDEKKRLWAVALDALLHEWVHAWGAGGGEYLPYAVVMGFGRAPLLYLAEIAPGHLLPDRGERERSAKEGAGGIWKALGADPAQPPLEQILATRPTEAQLRRRFSEQLGIDDPVLMQRLVALREEWEALYRALLKQEFKVPPPEAAAPSSETVPAAQGGLEEASEKGLEERIRRAPELEQGV
ncbi:MAG: hypothetical protein HYS41_05020 [Candidatus Omnitrophica bacterium]|nr:hypothetical protein [Candidatus Omnitrophota bacterium]